MSGERSETDQISDAVGRGQPVEKVTAGSIGAPEPGQKAQKTGLSIPEQGSEKSTEEFFNRRKAFSETRTQHRE